MMSTRWRPWQRGDKRAMPPIHHEGLISVSQENLSGTHESTVVAERPRTAKKRIGFPRSRKQSTSGPAPSNVPSVETLTKVSSVPDPHYVPPMDHSQGVDDDEWEDQIPAPTPHLPRTSSLPVRQHSLPIHSTPPFESGHIAELPGSLLLEHDEPQSSSHKNSSSFSDVEKEINETLRGLGIAGPEIRFYDQHAIVTRDEQTPSEMAADQDDPTENKSWLTGNNTPAVDKELGADRGDDETPTPQTSEADSHQQPEPLSEKEVEAAPVSTPRSLKWGHKHFPSYSGDDYGGDDVEPQEEPVRPEVIPEKPTPKPSPNPTEGSTDKVSEMVTEKAAEKVAEKAPETTVEKGLENGLDKTSPENSPQIDEVQEIIPEKSDEPAQDQTTALVAKVKERELQMEDLVSQINFLKASHEEHAQKLKAAHEEHAQKLKATLEEQAQKLKQQEEEYEDKLKSQEREYEEKLQAELEGREKKLRTENDEHVQTLKTQHDESTQKMKADYDQSTRELNDNHEEEMASLRSRLAAHEKAAHSRSNSALEDSARVRKFSLAGGSVRSQTSKRSATPDCSIPENADSVTSSPAKTPLTSPNSSQDSTGKEGGTVADAVERIEIGSGQDRLRVMVKTKQKRIEHLQNELKEKDKRIEVLADNLQSAQAETKALQNIKQGLEAKLENANAQRVDALEQADDLSRQAKELREDNAKMVRQVDDLRNLHSASEMNVANLHEEMQNATDEHDKKLKELTGELQTAHEEHEEAMRKAQQDASFTQDTMAQELEDMRLVVQRTEEKAASAVSLLEQELKEAQANVAATLESYPSKTDGIQVAMNTSSTQTDFAPSSSGPDALRTPTVSELPGSMPPILTSTNASTKATEVRTTGDRTKDEEAASIAAQEDRLLAQTVSLESQLSKVKQERDQIALLLNAEIRRKFRNEPQVDTPLKSPMSTEAEVNQAISDIMNRAQTFVYGEPVSEEEEQNRSVDNLQKEIDYHIHDIVLYKLDVRGYKKDLRRANAKIQKLEALISDREAKLSMSQQASPSSVTSQGLPISSTLPPLNIEWPSITGTANLGMILSPSSGHIPIGISTQPSTPTLPTPTVPTSTVPTSLHAGRPYTDRSASPSLKSLPPLPPSPTATLATQDTRPSSSAAGSEVEEAGEGQLLTIYRVPTGKSKQHVANLINTRAAAETDKLPPINTGNNSNRDPSPHSRSSSTSHGSGSQANANNNNNGSGSGSSSTNGGFLNRASAAIARQQTNSASSSGSIPIFPLPASTPAVGVPDALIRSRSPNGPIIKDIAIMK